MPRLNKVIFLIIDKPNCRCNAHFSVSSHLKIKSLPAEERKCVLCEAPSPMANQKSPAFAPGCSIFMFIQYE